MIKTVLLRLFLLNLLFAGSALAQTAAPACQVSLLVLGVAQDGGKPQLANPDDPAWQDSALQRLASSVAVVDRRAGQIKRWLFDATPDFKRQLQQLDQYAPVSRPVGLDGIFLTHAHIGHYAGLLLLGHESAGASGVAVYAMPGMREFLSSNGPWDQLIRYRNIRLQALSDKQSLNLAADLNVTPFSVPHRQEYSEVVGFRIQGPGRSAVYLPDIDSWEQWDAWGTALESLIQANDVLFLDATFYASGEIPGRDMSEFPHPLVTHTMQRLAELTPAAKAKVHFIHMNHTNPLHIPGSAARTLVTGSGFGIAEQGRDHCL